jgi:peptidoglycan/xylan/chitin deacetylase (PgdA/CDA1 family)
VELNMSLTATTQRNLLAEVRPLLRTIQRGAAAWSAALLGDAAPIRGGRQFGILMYHRVTDPVVGHPEPTYNVTPTRLREQLSGLLSRGFQPWPLRKVLEYRRARRTLPKRTFVVTFDDGYANNLTLAAPILRDLKVPATIFLATGFIGSDQPFPFDDWIAKGSPDVPADAWQPLSLDQCRQLQATGVFELAAHTHTHQDFRGRLDEFRSDLKLCREFLRQQLDVGDPTFAFPYGVKREGYAGPVMSRIVREVGLSCSLTTEWELARLDGDPFDWGRFQVDQRDTPSVLAGKLAGWFTWLRSQGKQVLAALKPKKSLVPGEPAPLRLGRFR